MTTTGAEQEKDIFHATVSIVNQKIFHKRNFNQISLFGFTRL